MCPLNLLSIIVWSLFIWRAHGVMRWPSMFMIHQEHVIWAFTTYMNFSMEVIHEFYLFYQTFSFQWMNATTCWGRTDYTLLEQVNIWSTLFIFWISEKSWLHHLSTGTLPRWALASLRFQSKRSFRNPGSLFVGTLYWTSGHAQSISNCCMFRIYRSIVWRSNHIF